jgi:hypothetical protein
MKSRHSFKMKKFIHQLNRESKEELDELNISPIKLSLIREGQTSNHPKISPTYFSDK